MYAYTLEHHALTRLARVILLVVIFVPLSCTSTDDIAGPATSAVPTRPLGVPPGAQAPSASTPNAPTRQRGITPGDVDIKAPICDLSGKTILILPFGDDHDFASHLETALVSQLMLVDIGPDKRVPDSLKAWVSQETDKETLPRVVTRDRVEQALKELDFQMSALFDEATAARVGRFVAANYMVAGKAKPVYFADYEAERVMCSYLIESVKVIDIERAVVLWSETDFLAAEVPIPRGNLTNRVHIAERSAAKKCARKLALEKFKRRAVLK